MPELDRYPDAELDGEFLYLGHRREMAVPPPELYLRKTRNLDLLNPGPAALDIARTVGGVFAEEVHQYARDIAGAADGARERFAANRGRWYKPVDRVHWYKPVDDRVDGRGLRVHVDEIAYRLRSLDILGRHAVAYRNGEYLAPVWKDVYEEWHAKQITTDEDAWWEFSTLANQALKVFHVRVRALKGDGQEIGWDGVTFLEAGVLQIVNDLADEVDYLTCPHCGLIFARQVGGSTHFSRSTGVTYCSPQCATNARVKAYRARKRAERTG